MIDIRSGIPSNAADPGILTDSACSLARFANLGANKELFSAMCFISPASCPQGVATRSLRNYVECGGLTPLSAAQLDATQVARGGS
jgi:hypothetical protein